MEVSTAITSEVGNTSVQRPNYHDLRDKMMEEGDSEDFVMTTCDMHTAGEPLRILSAGYPEPKGESMLEKMNYARDFLDEYRQLMMNEPRGHAGMYGAIVIKPSDPNAQIGTLFIHNEGYSTMCGHGVIALGRYAVDKGLVSPVSPETEVAIECPCGIVRAYVEYDNKKSGRVRFHSVPAYVYKLDVEVVVEKLGKIKVDIAYGGAFYAFFCVSQIGMDLVNTPLLQLVDAASKITDAVKEQVPLHHPEGPDLAFLYGTILTDDNDNVADRPTANICVFGDKQVDRSPTGSGVTARIAVQYKRGYASLDQVREFRSLIGTRFLAKAIKETKCGPYEAVIVEVSGMAHYMGEHTFRLEKNDSLFFGFQLPR